MAVSETSPQGTTTKPFVRSVAVTWNPRFTVPRNVPGQGPLQGNNLTMTPTAGGSGVGTCISEKLRRSAGQFYWEITWAGSINVDTMPGGVGFLSYSAIIGAETTEDLSLVFEALAADGTNGIILRPDGSIWLGGEAQVISIPAVAESDSIGIYMVTDPEDPSLVFVSFLGIGGAANGYNASSLALPAGGYIPVAVFGNIGVFDTYSVTARFSQDNQSAFLGPAVFPDLLTGFTLGWPTTQEAT